ncbi:MAG: Mur ligase domain-containing protein [Bacteroidia bacterium]|nr:Mur ligase domain-containing protein [Bacteroidia bacterium]
MALPKKLRLWGIGGVGMSAIAQHLHLSGHLITGYDREPSPFTKRVESLGIFIDYAPNPAASEQAEGVIYTPAISAEFPEWEVVKALGLPTWRRGEVLAELVGSYDTLAVAGAHGKTTTAAILSWLLHAIGESPVAFVGGLMRNFDNNYLSGSGPWAVVEADEYDRAMLHLRPAHAIVQSTDPDHLEIYGTPEGVEAAYRAFVQQVKGLVVVGPTVPSFGCPVIRYALEQYEVDGTQVRFRYRWNTHQREAQWFQIGRHLAENAAAALTLLEAIGFDFSSMQKALRDFKGVWRRMEVSVVGKHIIVDDYAHHPTEIRRTLQALRESFPKHKLLALFQPHLYSRTAFFAKDFSEALSLADYVLLFPIYAAREPSTSQVTSKLISQHLHVPYTEVIPLDSDMTWLESLLSNDPSIYAFLGAGDIYRWIPAIYACITKNP